MGILDLLKTNGSNYTKYNGTTPTPNPGTTKQSKLHASNDEPGSSLGGAFKSDVDKAYQAYDDGFNNILPSPSQLDRKDGSVPDSDKYINNLPE